MSPDRASAYFRRIIACRNNARRCESLIASAVSSAVNGRVAAGGTGGPSSSESESLLLIHLLLSRAMVGDAIATQPFVPSANSTQNL